MAAGKSGFAAMLLGPKGKPDAGPPAYGGEANETTESAPGTMACPSCGCPLQLTAMETAEAPPDAGMEAPPMGGQGVA